MSQAPQEPPSSGPPSSDAPTQRMPDGRPPDGSGGSRNLWTVLGVGAGVAVLAVVLFLLLRPDDDSENTAATTPTEQTTTSAETTTEATTTAETTTEEATTTAPTEQAQGIRVVVENAEPVGGVQRYEVDEGDEVVLIVQADVEDEVHLHGYDLAADVAPDHPARIRFTADAVGEFEFELEDRGVPIGELVVS
jgi:hypothetical protein